VVSTTTAGVTLAECYQKARHISETLGISEEQIRVVEAQYRDALGSILPHISYIKEQFFQENIQPASNGSNVSGSFLKSTQPQSYFQLQQPLFSGFRDWTVLEGSKSLKKQTQYNVAATDQQLLSDVATAFFTAITTDQEILVLTDTRKLTSDRVNQLTHWVDIGRSREAEVISAQSQLATLDAEIEDQKRTNADARQLLLFLTGVPAETPLLDNIPPPPTFTVEDALRRAEKRPDLLGTVEALNQAGYNVRYASGGYWPNLSLTANYYVERFGFEQDVRWDAMFLLNVPIFSGFSTKAQVNEAKSQKVIAQLTLNRLKRDIDRQVRTAYDDLRYSITQTAAYDNAVRLADRNYHMQEKEYRLGLITNLELLQLLTDLQQTKTQALQAKYGAKLNQIRMGVAMGEGL
jgi:outer membrane protein